MIKQKLMPGVAVLCVAMMAALPLQLNAQSTNKHSAAESKEKTAKTSPKVTPFHGKLKSVDKSAKTIAVGEMTIQITSETKISKDEKPAVLADGVVGENVSGAYQKTADGKLHATKITFGAKAEKEGAKEKEDAKKEKEKAKK